MTATQTKGNEMTEFKIHARKTIGADATETRFELVGVDATENPRALGAFKTAAEAFTAALARS